MKRRFAIFICFCLFLIALCGCNPDNTTNNTTNNTTETGAPSPSPSDAVTSNYVKPTVLKDYFELVCENSNITIYLDNNVQNFLYFSILSTKDLDGVEIFIKSNLGNAVSRILKTYEEPTQMPAHVFLAYQGLDWAALEGDRGEFRRASASFESAYNETLAEMPSIYSYQVAIPLTDLGFNMDEELLVQKIDTLSITIGEQTKTYSVGNIQVLPGRVSTTPDTNEVGFYPVATTDYPCHPGTDGTITLCEKDGMVYGFPVDQNVTIQGLVVRDTEIIECEITITTPSGDKYGMRWDGKTPIDIDAGSKFSINSLIIRDPVAKDKVYYNVMYYPYINYTMDGVSYSESMQVDVRMRQDPFDIYAQKVDGVDTLPYYQDYKNYGK